MQTKNIKGKNPKERLTKARMQLLLHFPFFGELVMRMVFHESKTAGVGTTCIDHKGNMYYHPDWINGFINVEETMFELAHETMHLVQRAMIRFPNGGNHKVWNIAADIKVDSILIESGLKPSRVSRKNITPELMELHKGRTTEQIYYHLLKNPDEVESFGKCPHCQPSCAHKPGGKDGEGQEEGKEEGEEDGEGTGGSGDGKPCPACGGGGPNTIPGSAAGERGCTSGSMHGDPGSAEQIEKFKQYVIAAALASKDKGKYPAFADEFLVEMRKPTVTWKDHLRRACTSNFKGRYTHSRPSRRSRAIGVRLQSRTRSPNGAVIMIDTSGSISDRALSQFVSECSGILRETGCRFLKIYFHDVMCYHIEKYDLKTIRKIKATRGGTSHLDVFEKLEESKDKIGMVVAFTDLYTTFPPKAPSYPVLWAHPENDGNEVVPPFGKKVAVKLNEE